MNLVWMLVIAVLVLLVLALVASLLGRHEDQDPSRDPRSHEHRWESPHLESRDEYELTHDTGSPHLESRREYEKTHAAV